MMQIKSLPLLAAVLLAGTALAGPNTTRILSFEFSKYESLVPSRSDFGLSIQYGGDGIIAESPRDSRERPHPNFLRNTTLAVIEKTNGEIVTAPLTQGGRRGFGITATAVFPSFEIDQVRHIGIKEASPGSSPSINDFNGIKVIAITESGAKLIVRRLPQIHPLGTVVRSGYRAFPQLGTIEALPQVSKYKAVMGFGDGINDDRTLEIELEDIHGFVSGVTFVRAADNRTREVVGYFPMTMNPLLLHKINIHRGYTSYGPGNDECELRSMALSGGDPDLPATPLYESGRMSVKLVDMQSWQTPVLNLRTLPRNMNAQTVTLTIYTGEDDLRTESAEVSETSRLILELAGSPNGGARTVLTKTVPDENDIRRGAFRTRTAWSTNFEFQGSTFAQNIQVFALQTIMGRAGTGPPLLATLRADLWTLDGMKIQVRDSQGRTRNLYSNFLSEKIGRNITKYVNFSEFNRYVNTPLTDARLISPIELPAFRPDGR
jgi:hypothetical protein